MLCSVFFFQQVALNNGLILVDTKYEFGKTADGTIMLIDEVAFSNMILSSQYFLSAFSMLIGPVN